MRRNNALDRRCVGTTLQTGVASLNTFALFPTPPPLPLPEPIDVEAMFPTDDVQGVAISIGRTRKVDA